MTETRNSTCFSSLLLLLSVDIVDGFLFAKFSMCVLLFLTQDRFTLMHFVITRRDQRSGANHSRVVSRVSEEFGKLSTIFAQTIQMSQTTKPVYALTLDSKKVAAPVTPTCATSMSVKAARRLNPESSANSPAAALRNTKRNWSIKTSN